VLKNNMPILRFFQVIGGHDGYAHRARFNATEVRHLLRSRNGDARCEAALRCMASTHHWLPDLPEILEYPFRYHTQMARIVYWHARGDSLEMICERMGDSDSVWRGERALTAACGCIAKCLNRDPAMYWNS
jgi:hypothetical protein